MNNNTLEIVTDASIRKIDSVRRTFGCAGALCINNGKERYMISQDTTNNRSELLAIYIGIELARDIYNENPDEYSDIIIYSDSMLGVHGLTKWIDQWYDTMDSNGIIYARSGKPIKNQEMFGAIITLLVDTGIKINFRHCPAHVCLTPAYLEDANKTFYENNGYWLKIEDIFKICYYNGQIDSRTRAKLENIDPNRYPVIKHNMTYNLMSNLEFPRNYKKYVG